VKEEGGEEKEAEEIEEEEEEAQPAYILRWGSAICVLIVVADFNVGGAEILATTQPGQAVPRGIIPAAFLLVVILGAEDGVLVIAYAAAAIGEAAELPPHSGSEGRVAFLQCSSHSCSRTLSGSGALLGGQQKHHWSGLRFPPTPGCREVDFNEPSRVEVACPRAKLLGLLEEARAEEFNPKVLELHVLQLALEKKPIEDADKTF